MYAIIATGGKQYKVAEGDVIKVEKLGAAAGETVYVRSAFSLLADEGLTVGAPTVAGATVTASVVIGDGKGKKGHRLQVQEKIWISQEEWSQTAVHGSEDREDLRKKAACEES